MKADRVWLAGLILLITALPLSAAIRVEKAMAGVDGFVRADRWIPVVFQLRSDQDFRGTIEVIKGTSVFRKSLNLSAGRTKRVELQIYFGNYYEVLQYRILSDDREVLKDRLESRLLNYQDNLVAVVSSGEYNHQFLNGEQNPWGGKTFVVYLRPEELYSEWITYSVADALAIGALSPSQLPPGRWKALLQHAASGSALILSPATDFSLLQDPFLRNHLPQISGETSLTGSGDFLIPYWPPTPPAPFPEITIHAQHVVPRPQDRPILPQPDGSSLITASPYYKGSIIYFAFDYTRLPDSMRQTAARFWNDAVFPTDPGPPVFEGPFRARLEDNPRVQKDLYNIPGLRLPEMKWFALFFFIYFCAIGPLQYVLVRSLKKNTVLWVSFPATILLFSLISFGYGEVRRIRKGSITQVVVSEVFTGLQQQVTYQVYGTAVADSGRFDFRAVPDNSYLRKFVQQAMSYQPEPFVLSEDLPYTLVGENLKSRTFRTFDAITVEPVSYPVRLKTTIEGNTLLGEVVNESRVTLTDAFYVYDYRNSAAIPTLEPGERHSFRLELANKSVAPMAEKHLRDLQDLYSSTYIFSHFLHARIQDAKGEIIINDKPQQTSCTRYLAVYAEATGGNVPLIKWPVAQTPPPVVYR